MLTLSRDQVRNLDRIAVERYGIPGIVLMENAGRGAVDAMERLLPVEFGRQDPFVCIVAGKGNNGGDGFVIARHLALRGLTVQIALLGDRQQYSGKGDAALNFEIAERMGLDIWPVEDPKHLLGFTDDYDIMVDAVLGTGISGEVRGLAREAIDVINQFGQSKLVFAVDTPSGLDCDTGEPLGVTVKAAATATFAAMKQGFLEAGADYYTGRVEVVSIGCPVEWE
jgi:NAD(P)H-hydrate epimerase